MRVRKWENNKFLDFSQEIMYRRVVITGMGIYSCLGKNLEEVKASLYAGKSGIILDPVRKELGYRSGLTGFVERPALKGLLDRRSRIMLPEQGEYAYMATVEALQEPVWTRITSTHHEIGIMYGNDSSAKPVIDAIDIMREKERYHAHRFCFGVPDAEFDRYNEPFYHF